MSGDWALGGQPRHIAVEGPIGVGKTTLSVALARQLGGETVLEAPAENPFLERFYAQPRAWALPAQLSFLLQRARQARELAQPQLFAPTVVSDFMVEKDALFAELTLDVDEFELYRQVYAEVMGGLPVPDLVIYLHAPLAVLLSRIETRAITYEQAIEADYLARLAGLYGRFFATYDAAPLLVVDTTALDFANADAALERLLQAARQIDRGRRFLDAETLRLTLDDDEMPFGWR
ncbi:MAG: deoxynucleoside kinase [Pseudomonadota bacterium]